VNDGLFTRLSGRVLGQIKPVRPRHDALVHWGTGDKLVHDPPGHARLRTTDPVSTSHPDRQPTAQPATERERPLHAQTESVMSGVGERISSESPVSVLVDDVEKPMQTRKLDAEAITDGHGSAADPDETPMSATEPYDMQEVLPGDEPRAGPSRPRVLLREIVTEHRSDAVVPKPLPIANTIVSPMWPEEEKSSAPEAERTVAPSVNVTIDRIEIRATKDKARPAARRKKGTVRKPKLGLEQYLAGRNGTGR